MVCCIEKFFGKAGYPEALLAFSVALVLYGNQTFARPGDGLIPEGTFSRFLTADFVKEFFAFFSRDSEILTLPLTL